MVTGSMERKQASTPVNAANVCQEEQWDKKQVWETTPKPTGGSRKVKGTC